MINAIVCVDENWAIGRDNELLFNLHRDMSFFRCVTLNKVVVCGRKTLESFPDGAPLKNRSTICLCSPKNNRDDCYCVNSVEETTKLLNELSKTQDVWIIGGAKLYETFLPLCEYVYVTKVLANGNGTVYFPNLDQHKNFKCIRETPPVEDSGELISFCLYERIKE